MLFCSQARRGFFLCFFLVFSERRLSVRPSALTGLRMSQVWLVPASRHSAAPWLYHRGDVSLPGLVPLSPFLSKGGVREKEK